MKFLALCSVAFGLTVFACSATAKAEIQSGQAVHNSSKSHQAKTQKTPVDQLATVVRPRRTPGGRGLPVYPSKIVPDPGEIGTASWYGREFQGRRTSSGLRFDSKAMVAAHRTLPLHSRVRVTNLKNGRSVELTVVDRGPSRPSRVIDVSEQAARLLDMKRAGLATVRVEPLGPAFSSAVQTAIGD